MQFSVECVARGWTVTEPTTPTSVRRVVEEAWDFCGNEGRVIHLFKTPFDCDHLIQTMSPVTVAMKFGLPWHQSVPLLSGG